MANVFFVLFIIFIIMAFSVSAMILVRRKVHHKVMAKHNDVAGFIYAVIGVIYAVLLAFVVVVVWELYRDADTKVEIEAKYMADLFRDAATLSPEIQRKIQSEILNYAGIVVDQEWQLMADGKSSSEALDSINRVFSYYKNFEPVTEHDKIWYAEQVSKINEFSDARNMRIVSSKTTIPLFMWTVIIMGAFITIGFSMLFGTENSKAQGLMVAALSGIIALVVILIFALSNPFDGLITVSPEPFTEQIELFKTQIRETLPK